ncbi:MAG: alpha/beta hydrolase [Chitinophagaceae bacterium BSSC1]|jgi:fermentation-respiration switch protein FrsA (DUF1100 family)|nr:MAG: alpha/beta hydrolase [Chitinophagaceae bacterium BSSC1]
MYLKTTFIPFLIILYFMTQTLGAMSQNNVANPFGLVYGNAIKTNQIGKVQIHPTQYILNGITISANIYTPPNYDSIKKYPVLVVAHPNGGVKEQVAGLYAQNLAEQGYICIAADAAYQGASGGLPRNVDKPANRIDDIHGMADFMLQYPGADPNRIGLLGICGGGGYALAAAQTDKRFKSIATISMFNSGIVRRDGFMGSQVATLRQRLQQAAVARTKEASGGEVLYIGSTTKLTKEQIDQLPFDLYRQGYEYYNLTHAHQNSTARYTMSSIIDLAAFDATTNMRLLDQPLLMIAGSKADSYYMTDGAFKAATGTTEKEIYLIDGATHIETYWVPKFVNQAILKLRTFFNEKLK